MLAKLSDTFHKPLGTSSQSAPRIITTQDIKRLYPSLLGPLASLKENHDADKRMLYLNLTWETNSPLSDEDNQGEDAPPTY